MQNLKIFKTLNVSEAGGTYVSQKTLSSVTKNFKIGTKVRVRSNSLDKETVVEAGPFLAKSTVQFRCKGIVGMVSIGEMSLIKNKEEIE